MVCEIEVEWRLLSETQHMCESKRCQAQKVWESSSVLPLNGVCVRMCLGKAQLHAMVVSGTLREIAVNLHGSQLCNMVTLAQYS